MPQTTEYYSAKNAKIEMSTNGSAWTDVSGMGNTIEWDGFERQNEFTHTFSGDTPILTTGKREGGTVKLKAVYTEGASDVFTVANTSYEGDSAFYLRWSPRGGTSTQKMFTTAAGKVTKPVYPIGDAGSGEAILIEVEMTTPSITVSTVA